MASAARPHVLRVLLAVAIAAAVPCALSDPAPLQDFCVADLQAATQLDGFPCKAASAVVDGDFFSRAIVAAASTRNPFGVNSTRATVATFPGLNTLGLSITRVDLAQGGLNPPHSHPRASELVMVLKGEVMVGFTTGTNQLFSKVVKENELFVVPRGLQHFQLNTGAGDAVFVAMFDSQSPGVVTPTFSLFATKPAMPIEVLTKTFLVGEDEVGAMKSKFAGF
ncbi:germin-like protein 1-2 [Phragmites australis]|uniref:germin-like protein 1-2 n=1 Tax=Phragmites australis TaxID=29695 RepID=UPI002D78EE1F|nr:germin-like protein 1-2 [Phragmites australis]